MSELVWLIIALAVVSVLAALVGVVLLLRFIFGLISGESFAPRGPQSPKFPTEPLPAKPTRPSTPEPESKPTVPPTQPSAKRPTKPSAELADEAANGLRAWPHTNLTQLSSHVMVMGGQGVGNRLDYWGILDLTPLDTVPVPGVIGFVVDTTAKTPYVAVYTQADKLILGFKNERQIHVALSDAT